MNKLFLLVLAAFSILSNLANADSPWGYVLFKHSTPYAPGVYGKIHSITSSRFDKKISNIGREENSKGLQTQITFEGGKKITLLFIFEKDRGLVSEAMATDIFAYIRLGLETGKSLDLPRAVIKNKSNDFMENGKELIFYNPYSDKTDILNYMIVFPKLTSTNLDWKSVGPLKDSSTDLFLFDDREALKKSSQQLNASLKLVERFDQLRSTGKNKNQCASNLLKKIPQILPDFKFPISIQNTLTWNATVSETLKNDPYSRADVLLSPSPDVSLPPLAAGDHQGVVITLHNLYFYDPDGFREEKLTYCDFEAIRNKDTQTLVTIEDKCNLAKWRLNMISKNNSSQLSFDFKWSNPEVEDDLNPFQYCM